MRTILVTGGAGFIGSTFVRQLLASGSWRIVNLDSLTYASSLHSLEHVQGDDRHVFVEGDIRDKALVPKLLKDYECESLVHFAAESHVDRSISNPSAFAETNVMGTLNLLEASLAHWRVLDDERKGKFRFLHVSTGEVYGSLGPKGHFTEESRYLPNSPYSASKAASDHFVRAYHETYRLPTLTTHCSNNYGPYQFPEKLIPLMILSALEGKPLPVYGTGENIRDWIHVEDHCEAIRTVLERGVSGETYNIGGNCELSNLEVVYTICDAVDRFSPEKVTTPSRENIKFVTDRPGHDFRYAIDSSKIQKELGWTPKTPFVTGIEQAVGWYLENLDWVQEVSGSYAGERLGLVRDTDESNGNAMAKRPTDAIDDVIFRPLATYNDDRGWLTELYRDDELPEGNLPRMAYLSETLPGVSRGPHEHADQSDYFAFYGPGDFDLYLWDSRENSPTFGKRSVTVVGESNPVTVIIPPGVVHAYKNISEQPARVFNAPNRLYAGKNKQEPVDEIRHEDTPGSPYSIEAMERPCQPTT